MLYQNNRCSSSYEKILSISTTHGDISLQTFAKKFIFFVRFYLKFLKF